RTRRQTRAADERLRAWGEWTARAIRGEGGYIRSLAGDLTGLGCGGSTNPDANGMPDGIFDTDRAVQQLTDRQRDAVEMEYLHSDLLQEQRARRLGVAVKAYEKLLSRARLKIFQALYVPSGGACSRLLNRRCEKSG
ncbi:MAG: sigma-70 region 4 domain-containing protein, partial [Marinobacterium sp.]|nr:sigma-70 region 4 domain-containing protein [Marinobacterium sp.]